MPVLLIETMNGTPERNNSQGYGSIEYCIETALGKPERLIAYNTYQVKNYDRYELAGFSEEAKRQWRDEHWEEDLQKPSKLEDCWLSRRSLERAATHDGGGCDGLKSS